MHKNIMNQLAGQAALFIALVPLSSFAMGKKPPTDEALKKLYTQEYKCDVVSAERRTNGKLTDSLQAGAPTTVKTGEYTVAAEGKSYKTIDIPLRNPQTAGPSNTPSVGTYFQISADTVKEFDEDALVLSSSESMWESKSLEIDLKSGDGKLEWDMTWGWDQRHDTEEAVLKNCKAL